MKTKIDEAKARTKKLIAELDGELINAKRVAIWHKVSTLQGMIRKWENG